MRNIILRGEYPFEEKLKKDICGVYRILPVGIFINSADVSIICNPSLEELQLEVEKSRLVCPDTRIIVLGSIYIRLIASCLFDSVYIAENVEELERIIIEKSPARRCIKLTEKEKLFLSVMERGLSNSELTAVLNISERTVRRLKSRLLDKTGLVSSEQLAVFSLVMNLSSRIIDGYSSVE